MVRDSDIVSRHGGDEFLVLLSEISNAPGAGLIAAKILAAVSAPTPAGPQVLHLSMSIGFALYPEDGEDAQTLIGRADVAMSRAKRNGRASFVFYADGVADDETPRPPGEPARRST